MGKIKYMSLSTEEILGNTLRKNGLRLAIAESCTGGLMGHRITNIPGSSTYYMGSITAYAYEAKVRLIGVKWSTLEAHGAVSLETVSEMALGVRRAMAADIGISVSGIAGPTGGSDEKPVGTVCFGLSSNKGIWATQEFFEGNRVEVKEKAAQFALEYVQKYLDEKLPSPKK
jgi:PncC family amidohydrolase